MPHTIRAKSITGHLALVPVSLPRVGGLFLFLELKSLGVEKLRGMF
nr:MAG TPA: hypothetical protein [Caudoviricetes sp.]